MEIQCERFQELSANSLADGHLRDALRRIELHLGATRDVAFSELQGAEELRARAHEIKRAALVRLDEHLERLESSVMRAGGMVHWASTAAKAGEIIERLAMERKVRRVVKGKSMVSEEIGLNEALMRRGVEAFETDLGEFIIQLAGEGPSHIVGPAIHKTKEQIAELFADKFGTEPMENPEDMSMFARNTLRRKFLNADMGITGVNFAVAETGTIVLFENEGNIRFATSVPKVHVAVMGIEKVIPGLEELTVLMKLLARSATGQKLPTYVSFITGPRRDREDDGPEEFHLIILDNGRSQILGDRELRETLYCIRCGACLNFCPVYIRVGGHAYGWVYSGPIGSVLTPQLVPHDKAFELPFASTLCGACAKVCPVKIDLPRLILTLRRRYAQDPAWGRSCSPLERTFFRVYSFFMQSRFLYEGASLLARVLQRLFPGVIGTGPMPPPLSRWTTHHRMSPLAEKPFRDLWRRHRRMVKTKSNE